ncbi:UNVERIFIED_CONTAM: hypothetical protein GTU68_029010 [Idotea baltica]|nr:hypothetical protein [Idotea baltica]
MFVLAVLAGAFIALGAVFATTVTAGASETIPFGLTKLLGGVAFSLGLILVVVAGAELFTGNNLVVMAVASGKVSIGKMLQGWLIVYLGNFVGSISTAAIVLMAKQYEQGGGSVGLNALNIANAKCELEFFEAFALGVLCNALVCLAIWLCLSARTVTDKVLAIIFPITAFVAAGFEHSVANMYFVPYGLLVKATGTRWFWDSLATSPQKFDALTWENFFVANLLPVTLGNIVGGALMVGLVYWFIHRRHK